MKGLDLSVLAGFAAIFIAPDGTGRWFGWALVQLGTFLHSAGLR